jgi:hypothetical protein
MAWITLSTTDILNSLTEQEQAGLQTPSAQADLNSIVQNVTTLVRGRVNANKRNQGHLGPVGTIPDELHAAAISIGRFKWLTHLPGTQLITEDRRNDKNEAYDLLADAADGRLVVVRGDDIGTQTPPVGADSGSSGSDYRGPAYWPFLVVPGSELDF